MLTWVLAAALGASWVPWRRLWGSPATTGRVTLAEWHRMLAARRRGAPAGRAS